MANETLKILSVVIITGNLTIEGTNNSEQKLPLQPGEGVDSLVANDATTNIARSKNSNAFGIESQAGSFGFKLAELTKNYDNNTATYRVN
jgi:hypothetical protein